MKRILAVIVLLILIFAFAGGAAVYTLLPFFIEKSQLQEGVVRQIEEITENTCAFSRADISYFPFVRVVFDDFSVDWMSVNKIRLGSARVAVSMRLIPLFFGKAEISSVKIREGKLTFPAIQDFAKPFAVDNVDFDLDAFDSWRSMKFRLKGAVAGVNEVLSAQGSFGYEARAKKNWASLRLNGEISVRGLNLKNLESGVINQKAFKIEDGRAHGQIRFRKENQESWIQILGKTNLEDLIYSSEMGGKSAASSKINLESDFDLRWDPGLEMLSIKSFRLNSPVGTVESQGEVSLGTGQIQNIRLRGTGVLLESIPQYWISLKEAIPSNIGFSGRSDLELTLEGTWDHLSLHAAVDLTPAILTYAKYFSKPKDMPLLMTFDYLLKDGQILSGDFSLRFQEATLKGTWTDFDLKSGIGQLNVITNKFPLKGWESLLLPFQGNRLEGEMKILANWKGDFNQWDKLKTMVNVTVEKGRIVRKDSPDLQHVRIVLDYGSLGLEVKQMEFDLAGSPISVTASIYHLFENPLAKATIQSPHLEPLPLLNALEEWAAGSGWFPVETQNNFKSARGFLQDLFPRGEVIEDFDAELKYENKKWQIGELKLEAYGGVTALQGQIDLSQDIPAYSLNLEMDRISFARFHRRGGRSEGPLEGNLFLKVDLEGQKPKEQKWFDQIQGEGVFMITNGQFKTFDLLGSIGKVSELKLVNQYTTGATPFNDVHSRFVLKNKKLATDKLTLISPHIMVEANGGAVLEDGTLNYRLDAFLSPPLTEEVLQPILGKAGMVQGKQLGPMALLLSGPLGKPDIQLDPELFPKFLDELTKKKPQKILNNFLPEELFFERRTSNS